MSDRPKPKIRTPRLNEMRTPKGQKQHGIEQANGAASDVPALTTQELPQGWTRLSMGEVGRWFGGGTPSKSNSDFWTNGTIPWVSPKDMKCPRISDAQDHITEAAVGKSATNLVEPGSVLIVVRSGILQHTLPVAIADRQVALNQDLKAVIPNDAISSEYLALALKAFERDILHTCTKAGTTVQSIEQPVFLRYEIPVAPRHEQLGIVAEVEKQLTRLEAGVAALRRLQANLKRYRAAVLKVACEGKLVTTEAQLARDGKVDSNFETAEELLIRICPKRREGRQVKARSTHDCDTSLKDGQSIPEGWVCAALEDLSDSVGGFAFSSAKFTETGYQIVKMANIRMGKIDLSQRPTFISDLPMDIVEKCSLRNGDLVVTLTGTRKKRDYGYVAVVKNEQSLLLNQRIARVRPFPGMDSRYLQIAMQSESYRDRFFAHETGNVGQGNVGMGAVTRESVMIPPFAEQIRIVAEVERRLSVADKVEADTLTNFRRAHELRQSILKTVFLPNSSTGSDG